MINYIKDFIADFAMSRIKNELSKLKHNPSINELKDKYTFKLNLLKSNAAAKALYSAFNGLDIAFIGYDAGVIKMFLDILKFKKIVFYTYEDFKSAVIPTIEIAIVATNNMPVNFDINDIYNKLSSNGCKIVIKVK